MEEGKGEPVLFIHGSLGTYRDFTPAVRHVLLLSAEEFRKEFETPFATYMPELTFESHNPSTRPVLLLESERSPTLFHLFTDRLECAIPRTERVIIPGTGHVMHAGNPDAYARVIEHFVSRHEQELR